MMHQKYQARITKYAKIKQKVLKFKYLILALFALLLASVITFMSIKGMHLSLPQVSNVTYGQELNLEGGKALFSDISYEYLYEDNVYKEEPPTIPGRYAVRMKSNSIFGVKYSDNIYFEITKKETKLSLKNQTIPYGDKPEVLLDLEKDHHLDYDALKFSYEEIETLKSNTNLALVIDTSSIKILDENNNDVTSYYDFIIDSKYIVEIIPKVITITPLISDFEYDGMTHHEDIVDTEISDVIHNLNVDFNIFYKQNNKEVNEVKNVGLYEANIKINSVLLNGEDASKLVELKPISKTFNITPRNITITTGDATFAFDNTAHLNDTFTTDRLLSDHRIEIETTKITNVGTIDNKILSFKIYDKNNNDVTNQYKLNTIYGKLTVNKAKINIKLNNINTTYNGLNLSNSYYNKDDYIIEGKFYDDLNIYSLEVLYNKQKEAKNVGEYVVTISNINGIYNNYDISFEESYAIINKAILNIKINQINSHMYNGLNYNPILSYEVIEGSLFSSDVITLTYPTFEAKNVGIYTIKDIEATITNGRIDNYNLNISNEASFEIIPQNLELQINNFTKSYNDSLPFELENTTYTLLNGQFAENDSLKLKTQLLNYNGNVGDYYIKAVDYIFINGDENNYNIIQIYDGTLTVEKQTIIINLKEEYQHLKYDGKTKILDSSYFSYEGNNIPESVSFNFKVSSNLVILNAMQYELILADFSITNDLKSNYEVIFGDHKYLQISKADIKITFNPLEDKIYDNLSYIPNFSYEITEGIFYKDAYITNISYNLDNNINAGTYYLEITDYDLYNDDINNYNIVITNKILEYNILKRGITVEIYDYNKEYNSNSIILNYEIIDPIFYDIDHNLFKFIYYNHLGEEINDVINAGNYKASLNIDYFDQNSQNYYIKEYNDAAIKVSKKTLEVDIEKNTFTKVYDASKIDIDVLFNVRNNILGHELLEIIPLFDELSVNVCKFSTSNINYRFNNDNINNFNIILYQDNNIIDEFIYEITKRKVEISINEDYIINSFYNGFEQLLYNDKYNNFSSSDKMFDDAKIILEQGLAINAGIYNLKINNIKFKDDSKIVNYDIIFKDGNYISNIFKLKVEITLKEELVNKLNKIYDGNISTYSKNLFNFNYNIDSSSNINIIEIENILSKLSITTTTYLNGNIVEAKNANRYQIKLNKDSISDPNLNIIFDEKLYEFEISKKDIKLDLQDLEITYGDDYNCDEIEYSLINDEILIYSYLKINEPNVGIYELDVLLKYQNALSDNYNIIYNKPQLIVNKRGACITLNKENQEYIYDNNNYYESLEELILNKELIINGILDKDKSLLNLLVNNENVNEIINANRYQVTLDYSNLVNNYEFINNNIYSYEIKINKRIINITLNNDEILSYEYNQKSIKDALNLKDYYEVVNLLEGNVDIIFSNEDEKDYNENPYKLYISDFEFSDSIKDNYEINYNEESYLEVKINKLDVKVLIETNYQSIYDKSQNSYPKNINYIYNKGKQLFDDVTIDINGYFDIPNVHAVGEYKYHYEAVTINNDDINNYNLIFEDISNQNEITFDNISLTITKRTLNIEFKQQINKTYPYRNEEIDPLNYEGNYIVNATDEQYDKFTLLYDYYDINDEITTPKEVGTYYAFAKGLLFNNELVKENYEIKFSNKFTFYIIPAEIRVSLNPDMIKNKVFDNTPLTYIDKFGNFILEQEEWFNEEIIEEINRNVRIFVKYQDLSTNEYINEAIYAGKYRVFITSVECELLNFKPIFDEYNYIDIEIYKKDVAISIKSEISNTRVFDFKYFNIVPHLTLISNDQNLNGYFKQTKDYSFKADDVDINNLLHAREYYIIALVNSFVERNYNYQINPFHFIITPLKLNYNYLDYDKYNNSEYDGEKNIIEDNQFIINDINLNISHDIYYYKDIDNFIKVECLFHKGNYQIQPKVVDNLYLNSDFIIEAKAITINPRNIIISSLDEEYIYQANIITGSKIEADGLAARDKLQAVFDKKFYNAGSYKNEYKYKLINQEGKDAGSDYNIKEEVGTLIINKYTYNITYNVEVEYNSFVFVLNDENYNNDKLIIMFDIDQYEIGTYNLADFSRDIIIVSDNEQGFEGKESDYNFEVNGSLEIMKRDLNISFKDTNDTFIYNDSPYEPNITFDDALYEAKYDLNLDDIINPGEYTLSFVFSDKDKKNYNIIYEDNIHSINITINKRKVTVSTSDYALIADGEEHTFSDFSVKNLVLGHNATGYDFTTVEANIAFEKSPNKLCINIYKDNLDLTNFYDIEYVYGNIIVLKQLDIDNLNFSYKDEIPSCVTLKGFDASEILAYNFEIRLDLNINKLANLTKSLGNYEYNLFDVITNYNILYNNEILTEDELANLGVEFITDKLYINVNKLTINYSLDDIDEVYDGTIRKAEININLAEGDYLYSYKTKYEESDFCYNLEVNELINYEIRNELDENVTANYNLVITKKADYIINQREIRVSTEDSNFMYDGNEHSHPQLSAVLNLLDSHHYEVVNYSSYTEKGVYDNMVEIIILDENNNDVTSNYFIDYNYGTITIY